MMQKYVALLRGINVGGQKLIKMEALRKALQRLPIKNVSTYIQSGNIIFESENRNIEQLQQQISELIKSEFGFDVKVVVVTSADLQKIIENNPFIDRKIDDPAQPYVSILSETPSATALQSLRKTDFGKDEWVSHERWLYILYESAGQTKLSNSAIEKILEVSATSRNWKTIGKLFEML